MSDLKRLQHKKKEIILNLDSDEVEGYVMSLAQKYYASMIDNDPSGIEQIVESLNDIVEIYESRFFDISDYINYCLVISSNKVLKKTFDLNCRLWIPNEKNIDLDKGFNSLMYSLEDSRKKIINDESNVKELYEMVSSDESIDEAIVDKVFELYSALKIFNYGGEL